MNMFQLLSLLQNGNPNQIISQMVMNNPQAQALLNQMKQSNLTPKQYVEQYAKQNNIDINQMINTARNFGIKL